LLGPPGDYRTDPTANAGYEGLTGVGIREDLPLTRLSWVTDRICVDVLFDPTGRARVVSLYDPLARNSGWEAFLWHVKRLWRRWFP
jgi:hypothetical protein